MIINTRKKKKQGKKKLPDTTFEMTVYKDGVATVVQAKRIKGVLYVDGQADSIFNKANKQKKRKRQKETTQPSVGETLIANWFKERNIKFDKEKTFKDLISPISELQLRMDFYLLYKMKAYCVEFDGEQHFKNCPKFHIEQGDSLENQQLRDRAKDAYCKRKGIEMIRIRYDEINSVAEILGEVFK